MLYRAEGLGPAWGKRAGHTGDRNHTTGGGSAAVRVRSPHIPSSREPDMRGPLRFRPMSPAPSSGSTCTPRAFMWRRLPDAAFRIPSSRYNQLPNAVVQ
jgi:hypothetical protein